MTRSIDQFMTILTVVGLPCFAWSGCAIWKPGSSDRPRLPLAARVVAPIAVGLALGFPVVGIPALGLAAWLQPRRPDTARTLVDRVGWTIFAAGVALMATMTIFAAVQEDGAWRPFATIRLHSRILLGFAAVALVGPLAAFLLERRPGKKPGAEDPLA